MSGTTTFKSRKTPGVYVTEFAAFPPAVVGVATAIPVFIGYTQTAQDPTSNQQLYNKAVAISSMADYYSYFGYGFDAQYVAEQLIIETTGTGTAAVTTQFANGISVAVSSSATVEPFTPYDFQAPSYIANSSTASVLQLLAGQQYAITTGTGSSIVPQFNLYTAMQLFFANGGGNCYVVSVANYEGNQTTVPSPIQAPLAGSLSPVSVSADVLLTGIAAAADISTATMIVVPDACLLTTRDSTSGIYSDYQKVAVAMLEQAGSLQSRVAILDMPGAMMPANWTKTAMLQEQEDFESSIAPAQPYFSYGAAYGPAVATSALGNGDVDYTNLQGSDASVMMANNLLTTQALNTYAPGADQNGTVTTTPQFDKIALNIGAAFPVPGSLLASGTVSSTNTNLAFGTLSSTSTAIADMKFLISTQGTGTAMVPTPTLESTITSTDNYLLNATPLLGQMEQVLLGRLNVAPPSGIMAGIWTQSDALHGVQNAPANLSLNEVLSPKVELNDADQGGFNMPISGEAIDILRTITNRGVVVWGARTLDGNSPDYRYIQVRRTLIYLEQSIKLALAQFVFAANDASTWATVTATISNFLTQFWQAGGLMGSKASEAFTVTCGVPTTMSGQDVLNGYMVVNVTVQMIHPAEFIELTFTQTMAS
ncbi:MAG TPA: phage tail sheath C-terminal domain-containing protein [Rhodopila sp.]|jgi:phage tail sheath protein FI|nr:phage tail sheath C-terminal domain-containing protein [Rhodopila sp.]